MSLVEKDKMTELFTAAQSKATAATALDEIQLKSVAYAINSAANSGEVSVEYIEPLRAATVEALEAKGYSVTQIGVASKERLQLITWK